MGDPVFVGCGVLVGARDGAGLGPIVSVGEKDGRDDSVGLLEAYTEGTSETLGEWLPDGLVVDVGAKEGALVGVPDVVGRKLPEGCGVFVGLELGDGEGR